jgi:hypothetical protein
MLRHNAFQVPNAFPHKRSVETFTALQRQNVPTSAIQRIIESDPTITRFVDLVSQNGHFPGTIDAASGVKGLTNHTPCKKNQPCHLIVLPHNSSYRFGEMDFCPGMVFCMRKGENCRICWWLSSEHIEIRLKVYENHGITCIAKQ